jgi:hypothetical protein
LNVFFSKQAVVALEPIVQSKVEILSRRFAATYATREVIRVDAAFMALTMDVICQYSFANDDNMLEKDDFNLAWKELIVGSFEGAALLRQFPWIINMVNSVPEVWLKKLIPSMGLMLDWKIDVKKRIAPILGRTEKEKPSHRTIFHEMRDDPNIPDSEKTMGRLCDEGQGITGAGSETTAQMLTFTVFHLLRREDALATLKKVLLEAMPDAKPVAWQKLERLPYLVLSTSKIRRVKLMSASLQLLQRDFDLLLVLPRDCLE